MAAAAIEALHIQAAAIDTSHLTADSVDASKINVSELSAIVANLGTVVSGLINNSTSPTRGIRLGSTDVKPGTWTHYLDLAASGSAPFLKHGDLELRADGTYSWPSAVENPPQVLSAQLSVADNGSNDTYTVTWNRNATVSDTDHYVRIYYYREGVLEGTVNGQTPSDDGDTWTDTGGGDGVSDSHHAVVDLYNQSGGAVISSVTTRAMKSAI